MTLPFIIKLIKLKEIDNIAPEEEQKTGIQLILDNTALQIVNKKYEGELNDNELVAFYKSNLESDIQVANKRLESLECDETEHREIKKYHHLLLEIYAIQRKELFRMRKEKLFSDEEIRKAELQLDLNELKITGGGH
ncbi:hypothetical protein [Chryseobacterium sp. 8AT]|uniref:hypothetical protein n=1 Tax=Chryseobacterium sp. 8AT TaxID=2653134 RepID=UPI0012F2CCD7